MNSNQIRYKCPCCQDNTLEEADAYEICPLCNWEDDPFQKEHPQKSGANSISLQSARLQWETTGQPIP
jgi:Zn finger protein HypA/HybF involved in hydrogenase expression